MPKPHHGTPQDGSSAAHAADGSCCDVPAIRGKVVLEPLVEGGLLGCWVWQHEPATVTPDERLSRLLAIESRPHPCDSFWKDFVHPDDHSRLQSVLNRLSSGAQHGVERMELRLRHGKGSNWALFSALVTERAPTGKPLSVEGILQDTADRKRLETTLREALEELNRKNDELASLAFITSHDLRSPVTSIVSLLDLYEEDPSTENAQFVMSHLSCLGRNLLKTLDTLNEVLIVRRSPDLAMENVSISSMLTQALHPYLEKIKKEGAVVDSDFSKCPTLFCNRGYMEGIIGNLVGNALKYRSPDRPLHVSCHTLASETEQILTIRDNGQGIDLSRHQRKVFGLNQTFHREGENRGTGLFVIKAQVEAMGGSIAITSTPGGGTEFTITLPKQV